MLFELMNNLRGRCQRLGSVAYYNPNTSGRRTETAPFVLSFS